jgi:hypothetical protein
MFNEESLLSDDSGDEEDFSSLSSTSASLSASSTPAAKKQRVTPRRSFNISADLLSEAVQKGGILDGDERCATLADITQYVATKRGIENDRALKNSIYQKLRNAKDIEKRDEHIEGLKRSKAWYVRRSMTVLFFRGTSLNFFGRPFPTGFICGTAVGCHIRHHPRPLSHRRCRRPHLPPFWRPWPRTTARAPTGSTSTWRHCGAACGE